MKTSGVRTPSLLLIICLITLPQISETLYSPALPNIAHALATSMTLVEWTLSIYFFGFALGVAIWGRVSDHIGRRHTALIGLVVYIVASLLCATSNNIMLLLAFRFIQAFGISVGSVITQTIMRDCFSGSQSNKIFSTVGAFLGLAPAIGPILGGFIVEYSQWRGNFILLALLGLMTAAYAFCRLPETRPPVMSTNNVSYCSLLCRMLLDRHVVGSMLLTGLFNGLLFSYYAHAPFIFMRVFHLSPSHYGLLGLAMALAASIGSMLSYRLNHHLSGRTIIRFACLLNGLAMALYVIADFNHFITPAAPLRSIVTIMLAMMTFYISFGLAIPNILSAALRQYKNMLGSAGAILGLVYYLITAAILFGIGLITLDPVKAMAVYFFALSVMMIGATWLLHQAPPHHKS